MVIVFDIATGKVEYAEGRRGGAGPAAMRCPGPGEVLAPVAEPATPIGQPLMLGLQLVEAVPATPRPRRR